MHSGVMRSVIVVALVATVILTSTGSIQAQEPGGRGNYGTVSPRPPQPDEFEHSESAAAFLVGDDSDGGRRLAGPPPGCTVRGHPARPAHYDWWSFRGADGTYTVGLNCVLDEAITGVLGRPDAIYWGENLWSRPGVRATEEDLAEIVAEALARLRPGEAGIHTSPGDGGVPSLVGIRTQFWVDEAVYRPDTATMTDGPLTVEVWADPTADRRVRWDTGEDTFECTAGTTPRQESCSAVYDRSSAGQPHLSGDDPAYEVTATYTYTGGYRVWLGNLQIGEGSLGQIERSSETFLPVAEVQAINTDD